MPAIEQKLAKWLAVRRVRAVTETPPREHVKPQQLGLGLKLVHRCRSWYTMSGFPEQTDF